MKVKSRLCEKNGGVNFPPRCTSLVHVTKRGNKNKMITGIIKDNDAEIVTRKGWLMAHFNQSNWPECERVVSQHGTVNVNIACADVTRQPPGWNSIHVTPDRLAINRLKFFQEGESPVRNHCSHSNQVKRKKMIKYLYFLRKSRVALMNGDVDIVR